ncbi:MAG: molybdopterin-dependent oxidoreductase [Deltaproteobacteria bacterium]|nr:molybdopterin-dependent oxidoreductase [Deltaproteobacteria bacterium]
MVEIFRNMEESNQNIEEVKTACAICPWVCGLTAYVLNGKILKIGGMAEHPWSRGLTCIKSRSMVDTIYSEHRIKQPLKKKNGGWQQISWEEAFDFLADKLEKVKANYGARALSAFIGDASALGSFLNVEIVQRFCQVYGSPNWFTPGSHCINQLMSASKLMFGLFNVQLCDMRQSRCVVLWGNNPNCSIPVYCNFIVQAKKRGAKLIVIDPRYTYLAKQADIYTPIRPGTDTALALGMMNFIISEDLYDKEFVEKWTIGFDKLSERIFEYHPEKVASITGISVKTITEMALMIATEKPVSISYGVNSLGQCASGFRSYQTIFLLQAIIGNVGIPGGLNVMPLPEQMPNPLGLPELMKERPLGGDQFPLIHELGSLIPNGEGQSMLLAETILTGKPYPIKAIISMGNNLLHELPNNSKTKEALNKLELLVVIDLFMTETAKMADLVLPTCTFFEREEILDLYALNHGIPYVILRKKAIDPIGKSLPDAEIWLTLGKKMFPEYFPWKDLEELYDYVYKPRGITVKSLREETPNGIFWGSETPDYKSYKKRGFFTPSGKVELYCDRYKTIGVDPLPYYIEPTESPISDPDLAKEYPVMLITGARSLYFYHSQFRHVPKLRIANPEPKAEIHPALASKYGIRDGEFMIIETRRGKLEIKANVTQDISPHIVSIPHGWEPNVNVLTSEKPEDPVFGFPGLKTILGKIKKKV